MCGYLCQHSLFATLQSSSRIDLHSYIRLSAKDANALLPLVDFIEEVMRCLSITLRCDTLVAKNWKAEQDSNLQLADFFRLL